MWLQWSFRGRIWEAETDPLREVIAVIRAPVEVFIIVAAAIIMAEAVRPAEAAQRGAFRQAKKERKPLSFFTLLSTEPPKGRCQQKLTGGEQEWEASPSCSIRSEMAVLPDMAVLPGGYMRCLRLRNT